MITFIKDFAVLIASVSNVPRSGASLQELYLSPQKKKFLKVFNKNLLYKYYHIENAASNRVFGSDG